MVLHDFDYFNSHSQAVSQVRNHIVYTLLELICILHVMSFFTLICYYMLIFISSAISINEMESNVSTLTLNSSLTHIPTIPHVVLEPEQPQSSTFVMAFNLEPVQDEPRHYGSVLLVLRKRVLRLMIDRTISRPDVSQNPTMFMSPLEKSYIFSLFS